MATNNHKQRVPAIFSQYKKLNLADYLFLSMDGGLRQFNFFLIQNKVQDKYWNNYLHYNSRLQNRFRNWTYLEKCYGLISASFSWEASSEGFGFWWKIFNKIDHCDNDKPLFEIQKYIKNDQNRYPYSRHTYTEAEKAR